jgi:hypothetical protein
MIIAIPPRENFADIAEQRFKIRREGIAGLVHVPHHLIEKISEAGQLRVDEPLCVAIGALWRDRRFSASVEDEKSPEMNGPHANRQGTPSDALKLAFRKAQIELPVAQL